MDDHCGQLWPAERAALYEEVFAFGPDLALEVGTWAGGGSTLQITKALQARGRGLLHTCEVDHGHYSTACSIYINSELSPYINLHLLPSHQLIAELAESGAFPDRSVFIFFDGPEDPHTAMADLVALEPHLTAGRARFAMHDWDHSLSVKQRLIRPYLEASARWHIYRVLEAPQSVGLVFADFLG